MSDSSDISKVLERLSKKHFVNCRTQHVTKGDVGKCITGDHSDCYEETICVCNAYPEKS